MQAKFDSKTNTISLESISVNPKANELSSSGKTYGLGYEKVKLVIEGREATVAVNVYVPVKKAKK